MRKLLISALTFALGVGVALVAVSYHGPATVRAANVAATTTTSTTPAAPGGGTQTAPTPPTPQGGGPGKPPKGPGGRGPCGGPRRHPAGAARPPAPPAGAPKPPAPAAGGARGPGKGRHRCACPRPQGAPGSQGQGSHGRAQPGS